MKNFHIGQKVKVVQLLANLPPTFKTFLEAKYIGQEGQIAGLVCDSCGRRSVFLNTYQKLFCFSDDELEIIQDPGDEEVKFIKELELEDV